MAGFARCQAFCTRHDLEPQEEREILMTLSERPADAPPPAPQTVRHARKAQAERGNLGGRRKDVEELAHFGNRAGYLPDRVKDVFILCLVHGLSHAECAARLGISPNTVRRHLARLRLLARQSQFREN